MSISEAGSADARIPLTRAQYELLEEFYSTTAKKIFLDKASRDRLWTRFKANRVVPGSLELSQNCPALLMEMEKSLTSGNNIQSAVFSECVYAQALADILSLDEFASYAVSPEWIPQSTLRLLDSYALVPRYIYKNPDSSRMLIQAGGHGGVDGALISVLDNNVFTIEFKEPGAKTSEPDLPKYDESGDLKVPQDFRKKYPQFNLMLDEQLEHGLNFWDHIGSNINNFSADSIREAVAENYAGKKFADVICTEDQDGVLVMIPSNQANIWARLEGEIRPAGRNPYKVWTPHRLRHVIQSLDGSIEGSEVRIPANRVGTSKARGGGSEISRYKLDSVFFVRAANVGMQEGCLFFSIEKVQQLNPTIAAKMFFEGLKFSTVRDYYLPAVV